MVFLPISDADCKFILFDVGSPGRRSDGGIFRDCEIGKRFFAGEFNLPQPSKVGQDGPNLPYYIVGDEGFPLSKFLMRPYARCNNLSIRQKIFNYRLSRARRVVECAFGMFVQRFRIFRKPIIARPKTIVNIVKAAACLHNLIIEKQGPTFSENFIDEMREKSTAEGFVENPDPNRDVIEQSAIKVRQTLTEYLMYRGSVPWQWQKVRNVEY